MVICMLSPAHAGKLIADRADATLRTDGRILLVDNWTIRVGENNAPSAGCIVIPFQLPDAGLSGELFETASLRVQLASITGNVSSFNLDLYALDRISDKPDVLSEDYYAGKLDRNAKLIADDFVTEKSPVRSKENPYLGTASKADEELANFLRDQWDDGKNAGKFVFLRLSPDRYPMPKGNNAYNIVAANASLDREQPTITFTGDIGSADGNVLLIPKDSDGKLIVQSSQIRAKGYAKVTQSTTGTFQLQFDNPKQGSGVQITPANHASYWDLSTWQTLCVDIENLSDTVQTRLLLQVVATGDKKHVYANNGIALNPLEKKTLRMIIPHQWKYSIPDGPRAPRKIDSTQVSMIELFMQWPFESEKKDIVNCEISNLRVENFMTPTTSMSKENFFPFIDEFGQYVHEDWPAKIHSAADLKANLIKEQKQLNQTKRPQQWNRYGGWANGPKLKATGNFRTEKVDGKWYFVDPDGRLFWSHGVDVLSKFNDGMRVTDREDWYVSVPDKTKTFQPTDYCLKLKYGSDDYGQAYYPNLNRRLMNWGMNSIGNWARYELMDLGKTPYTLQLTDYNWGWPKIQGAKRKFYDVWDERYVNGMQSLVAKRAKENPIFTKSLTDPMCIGYFIDNELDFGNRGRQVLVDSMLKSPATQAAKVTFIDSLKVKYQAIEQLNDKWETRYTSWDQMLESTTVPTSDGYREDSDVFFVKTVERYFEICRDVIKSIAPHRLYLGCRFISTDAVRPVLYEASKKYCDVLTVNVYAHSIANFPLESFPDMPVLIGEFHFGANSVNGRGMFHVGLCSTGITQADRALAYTRFVQGALVHPNIVGTHWFQYRDQPLTGRGDGEAYQIGFVDVADTPYEEICKAAREIGESMYRYRVKGKLTNQMTE